MSTRINTLHTSYGDGERVRGSAVEGFKQLLRTVALWHERARQRRALAELSDALLKDIGVSRADAMHEAGKAFWRD